MNSPWKRVSLAAVVLLVALSVATVPTTGRAQAVESTPGERVVDETVAVVGGTPLLRSDLEKRVQGAAEQLQVDLADTSVYNRLHREVSRGMIDDQLLLLEAEARNLKPSEEDISREVEGAIDQHLRQFGGQAGFEAQLRKEGLTEDELRREYRTEARKRILAGMLIQQEIRPKVTVTAEMGKRFFEENRAQIPPKPRALHLQQIILGTRADSLAERRARDNALEVRAKIQAGLSFEAAAAQYSDDPDGKEGGVLGRVNKGELEPSAEAAAFTQPVGEVGPPVLLLGGGVIHSVVSDGPRAGLVEAKLTGYGFDILLVTSRDSNGEWVELKHIFFEVPLTKSEEARTRERANDLRRRILSDSLDFTSAVHQYSDDPEASKTDGDLGWVPFEELSGEMRAVADTLRVGRVSPPVAVRLGGELASGIPGISLGGKEAVLLFKVLGEQAEQTYTYEEVAEQMQQYAGQKVMEEKLRAWLDELRKKYPVDQKLRW